MCDIPADVRVLDHGSIVQLAIESQHAVAWVDENVESEDWQWSGNLLAVDHRFAADLIDGMRDDALVVVPH